MEKEKITVFFGAGAEMDYGMPAGAKFSELLINNNYKDKIASFFEPKELKSTSFLTNSTRMYAQTIYEHQNEAENIFNDGCIKRCIDYHLGVDSESDERKKRYEYMRVFTKAIGNLLKGNDACIDEYCENGVDKEKVKDFMYKNAVFYSALDEKFNSLRVVTENGEPNKIAKRVMWVYTTVFVLIYESLYSRVESRLRFDKKSVIATLNKDVDWNLELDKLKERAYESYYEVVKKFKKNVNVVTTNYTDLCEKISGMDEVAYLHGRLNWFEDFKSLSVLDCRDKIEKRVIEDRDWIFPFIMIPSGVKPIIHPKQIREFTRFIRYLDDTNILVVVGYRFNSDDNHVNAIISDWLNRGKEQNDDKYQYNHKLVCINYDRDITWDKIPWISALGFNWNDVKAENFVKDMKSKALFKDKDHAILDIYVEDIDDKDVYTDTGGSCCKAALAVEVFDMIMKSICS